jgi:hypothetical protein
VTKYSTLSLHTRRPRAGGALQQRWRLKWCGACSVPVCATDWNLSCAEPTFCSNARALWVRTPATHLHPIGILQASRTTQSLTMRHLVISQQGLGEFTLQAAEGYVRSLRDNRAHVGPRLRGHVVMPQHCSTAATSRRLSVGDVKSSIRAARGVAPGTWLQRRFNPASGCVRWRSGGGSPVATATISRCTKAPCASHLSALPLAAELQLLSLPGTRIPLTDGYRTGDDVSRLDLQLDLQGGMPGVGGGVECCGIPCGANCGCCTLQ